MIDEAFLRSLGILIVTAAVFVMASRAIRMPAIVVYLLAGVVIGPVLGAAQISPALELISETGIALLLFLVGLELSFDKIRMFGRVAIVAGIGQVVFTSLGGFLLCWILGFDWMESLFLSTALTFSSTVVVVKLLDEKKELDSQYGRIAVGIFLVQNLVVIVFLTFLAGLGESSELTVRGMGFGVVKAFAGMACMLAFALLAARYLLPRPFRWAARSPEMLLTWSLSWCFILVLGADKLGLSLEVGAFLAGLSLAQLPYNADLRRRVHPLMNLFIAVFFVSLGIRMELGPASAQWLSTSALGLFVVFGNPFIFLILITWMGYGRQTAFLTSVTVAQISEFSFIFVGMGVAKGLVSEEILGITSVVGVITIAISAYLIIYNNALFRVFSKQGWLNWLKIISSDDVEEPKKTQDLLHGHILIVGMNTLGRQLVQELAGRGETVLAIDTDPQKLQGLPGLTLLGNVEYLSVLEEAGLPHAKMLISALHIEDANDLLAYRCQQFRIPCVVNVVDLSVMEKLMDLGVSYFMVPRVDGVKAQAHKLKELGYLKS